MSTYKTSWLVTSEDFWSIVHAQLAEWQASFEIASAFHDLEEQVEPPTEREKFAMLSVIHHPDDIVFHLVEADFSGNIIANGAFFTLKVDRNGKCEMRSQRRHSQNGEDVKFEFSIM